MEFDRKDSPPLLDLMAFMRVAQEAERTRVARRLHDEVVQPLAAFTMKCFAMDGRLRAADPRLADEIQAALPILQQAVSAIREVSEDLRPGVLPLGLDAAIEWHAERFQSESDIACVVDIGSDQLLLDPIQATELFRIFQEALVYIRRRSNPTLVDVKLRREGSDVILEIRGDGRPRAVDHTTEHALGILTMKERAARAGGACAIADSNIEVRIPLHA
jgi:signal transduction histidine kinase